MKTTIQLFKVQALKLFNPQRMKNIGIKEILKALLITFVSIILIGYIIGAAVGLGMLGLASLIPSYMLIIASAVIFGFTLLKASDIIFSPGDYELLMSLPIKPSSIITSRFLTMYVTDLLLTVAIMIPSLIVYAFFASTNILFWIIGITSVCFIPLIPLTIATIISIFVTAIASRFKHQNLMKICISILIFVGFIVVSMKFGNAEMTADLEQITDTMYAMTQQLHQIYPLEYLYASAMVDGSISNYVIFILLSIGIYVLFAFVLSKLFIQINSRLRTTGKQKAYVTKELHNSSQLTALYRKDITRYFSSSLYALNTGIGYVLVLIFAGGIFFSDVQTMMETIDMPFAPSLFIIVPFILSIMTGIGNTTPASISIEGDDWWIMQMIPANMKTILTAKMLVNLTLAIPTVLIATTFLVLSIHPGFIGTLLFYLVPLVYVVFQSVAGIALNLTFPKFDWQNETEIVKQGMPVFISIFGSMAIGGLPIVILFLVPSTFQYIFVILWLLLVVGITYMLYIRNNKTQINTVN